MVTGLRTLQNGLDHCLVRVTGHGPRVVIANDVLHTLPILDNIVDVPDALAESDKIEVIREEIQIDIGLFLWISRIEFDFAVARQWTHEVDNHGQPIPGLRGGEVPLKGISEHRLKSSESLTEF